MPDRDPDHPPIDPAMLQRQLVECRAMAQALQREQEVFAYGISHDLRAPLRAIDGFSALLAGSDSLDADARSHLARIRAASARMGGLIEALLELSRVNRAELHCEPVDLSLLAEWAWAERCEREPAREATLDVAPGLRADGDERLLKALLGQLFDNAWKFSRGPVDVVVRGEHADDALHVSLRDHGEGFDMRHADKLFEPFQRLHRPEEGAGNGIGLAIARRIVERHGGRLWAQSEPGAGSTFHLVLPSADNAG